MNIIDAGIHKFDEPLQVCRGHYMRWLKEYEESFLRKHPQKEYRQEIEGQWVGGGAVGRQLEADE